MSELEDLEKRVRVLEKLIWGISGAAATLGITAGVLFLKLTGIYSEIDTYAESAKVDITHKAKEAAYSVLGAGLDWEVALEPHWTKDTSKGYEFFHYSKDVSGIVRLKGLGQGILKDLYMNNNTKGNVLVIKLPKEYAPLKYTHFVPWCNPSNYCEYGAISTNGDVFIALTKTVKDSLDNGSTREKFAVSLDNISFQANRIDRQMGDWK